MEMLNLPESPGGHNGDMEVVGCAAEGLKNSLEQ